MTLRAFERIVEKNRAELRMRVDGGLIQNAKKADETAAELVGESRFKKNSKEFETLLAALYSEAGKLFPGNWEDYPRA